MNSQLIFIGITCIACLSPLLTFAKLWQVKTWRTDRLLEHMRRENWFRQLFGILRPGIVAIALLLWLGNIIHFDSANIGAIGVMGLLAIMQWITGRQRMPVWTHKAVMIAGGALLIDLLVLMLVNTFEMILVLLQPLSIFLAWLAVQPLDYTLKKRIMDRARSIRERHPDCTVIGITGSVGKTTTKELLAHVLSEHDVQSTPAHMNADIGVGRWLTNVLLHKHPNIIIVEMGAYRRGEIAELCRICQPNIGIVTYVGSQHIALFGSQEALRNAKGELVESISKDGHVFLNVDNDLCASLSEKAHAAVTSVGTGGHADYEAYGIAETADGIRFRIGEQEIQCPIRGTHNVSNILLCIAAAKHVGMNDQDIAQKIRTFKPPEQTFSVREEQSVTILDDTHNASPASFTAAIEWARSQPMEQKVLLTSGLIELGPQEERIHFEIGAQAAHVFDRVIFTTDRCMKVFQKGYGAPVELLSKQTAKTESNALLVCEGRMSTTTIQHLLP